MLGRVSLVAGCLLFGLGSLRAQDRLVEGRVVDLLGEPIPAATVRLVVHGQERGRTATDAQGFYRVRVRGVNEAELEFSSPGKVAKVEPCGDHEGQVLPIRLEDGARFHGQVTDAAGAPAKGTVVVVCAKEFTGQSACDDHGRFEFPAVPLRLCSVRAWSAGGIVERAVRVLGDTRCDLTLPDAPGAARRVRVTGLPAGLPNGLEGAHLQLLAFDQALQKERGRIALAADGTASFVATATCLVQVVVPGFVVRPKGIVIDKGPGSGSVLEFQLSAEPANAARPMAFVRGHLRDDAQRPVPGQKLIVEDLSHVQIGSGTAASDGSFAVPLQGSADRPMRIGIPCGDWRLQAEVCNLARGHTWTGVLRSGEGTLELVVERACGLRDLLRGPNGERLPFAEVGIARVQQPRRPLLTVTADRLGNLEVRGLPVDDYVVVATGDDGSIAVVEFVGQPGLTRSPGRWRLSVGGTLEGRLTDPRGRPVPGVDLYLASPGMRDEGDAGNGALDAKVTTDRLGRFRCRGRSPGDWTVVAVSDPRVGGERGEIVAGRTTFVELHYSEAMPEPEAGEGLAAPPPNGR
jgi:hypothetical protein